MKAKMNFEPRVSETLDRQWEPVYRSCLHYVISWSTRGRKPVLKERHALRLRQVVSSICEERGIDLLEVVVGREHVHLLCGLRPTHSVSTAVREMKSRAGLELLSGFPELRVWLGGNLVWDDRYSVETVSTARLEPTLEKLRNGRDWNEPLAQAS